MFLLYHSLGQQGPPGGDLGGEGEGVERRGGGEESGKREGKERKEERGRNEKRRDREEEKQERILSTRQQLHSCLLTPSYH